MGRFKKIRNLTLLGFLFSLFLHLGLGVRLVFLDSPKKPAESIEVKIVDAQEMERLRNQAKQIVEQSEKRLNDERDPNAKYLSRHDQRVTKQTRAEKTAAFENAAKQGMAPKINQKPQAAKQQAKSETQQKAKSKVKAASIHGDIPLPKLTDLKPKFEWEKLNVGVNDPGPESATDDHLKNLEKGAQTLLSTREFVYYTYYARIKERLRLFWEPKIREKVKRIVMSGERVPASDDRITKLIIILDQEGKLVKIQVLGASGVKDLDDAAIEAFQSAAPFPNPPKGIVEADGTIKIRWDFILEA